MMLMPPTPKPDPGNPPFLEFSPRPVPEAALKKLAELAQGRSGGAQAAKSILFWLGGRADQAGASGNGGLDLQRLDPGARQAALDVINWWAFPEDSDRLFAVLDALSEMGQANGGDQ